MFADALVVFADEIMEVAPNPTRARARTKLRIAMFFMVYFSLAVVKFGDEFLIFLWTNQIDTT